MKATQRRAIGMLSLATATALALAGCAAEAKESEAGKPSDATTVTVTDNHGSIELPVRPERVVALDNTSIQTLSDWNVELAGAAKPLFSVWPEYAENDDVIDVGMHREPNLEAIVEADADLVIGGYRFSSHYDDIKALNPNVIEISARDGEDHRAELKRQTEILGQIFDKNEEAKALNDAFDAAIEDAAAAYNGSDTVVGLVTSAGKISYSAPTEGRSVGVLFPTLGLKPGIEREAEDSSHGDEISVEAIAAANPDWLVVLDRDATFGEDDYISAKELIEGSEALQKVTAVQKGQIIYLDANFYLTEGIQAYTDLYKSVAAAFSGASE